ncbi:ubiquitin carboxyl-terminal hydrolase 20-like [Pyrus communis]|uniref:ubiquitin carboxyl-terminal hydrolase 20-like n=1 Tax=Pyrus communis TaxID=23211 RepID=UPI0035C1EA0B
MAEALDGSPPFSQSDAMDDLALVCMPEKADGFWPSSTLKPLGDQSLDSSLPNPSGSSPIFEQVREEEAEPSPPPSPLNLVGNNLSIYELNSSDSSRFSSSWYSPWNSWSSAKGSPISLESQFHKEETKPSMVSAGLANLGNTCFMNAILQCFTHTVPLLEGLRSSNHLMPCDRGSERFCVLCALRDHIDLSIASSGKVVSPWKLVDNLNHISSYFQRYQQEDAHEFLQCFLDKLERSSMGSMKKDESSSVQDKNLVEKVFGGRLVSKLRCCNCGHCSDTYEPLIDLSLEIEEADTLPRALESFTKIENINDSETKFTCEKCMEKVSVEKQLVVDQAPQVAAFHLKRFKTDGSNVQKIEKHVEFPLELDLKPYTGGSDIDVELKYELYAIVEHVGFSSTSGHYFCFIRSSPDTWHRLDDSRVTRVREEFVLSQEAYILFYARKGTPWFLSVVEALKPCLNPAVMSTSPKSVLENVESTNNLSPIVNYVDCCAANEPRDACETVTLSLHQVRPKEVDVSDTRGEASELSERINGPRRDAGCSQETTDTGAAIDSSTPGGGRNNFDKTLGNTENICSTSTPVANSCHKRSAKVILQPMTPPRSPSLDLVFESPEPSFHLPCDHVKSADNVTCKRSLNNAIRKDHLKSADNALCKRASNNVVDDAERTEAVRYLSKKSLTKGRASQLLAAMVGPQNGSSLDKKRKRAGSSPCKKVSRAGGSLKTNHTMRPVAAALR